MKPRFLYRRYAAENSDLAEKYGPDAETQLANHFQQYGQAEMRGSDIGRYIQVENLLVSDAGDMFISGWADRRFIPELRLTADIGYMRHEVAEPHLVWYERTDVSAVTGDARRPAGFFALLRQPDIVPHSHVQLFAIRQRIFFDRETRWLSADQFLNQVLGALVVLADQPIGQSFPKGQILAPAIQRLWSDFLTDLSFICVFESGSGRPVERSIVIVLHRKADFLIPQLQMMAAYLNDSATEIVLVANELVAAQQVVTNLTAFSQICNARISLHLCSGNAGFSRANNYGAEVARGETLIFMNPDVFPAQHDPQSSFKFLESNPGEALHGALLYYGNGTLMHSGMYTASDTAFDAKSGAVSPVLRVEHFGKGLLHRIDDAEECPPVPVAPVMASAALWKIRKKVFDDFGGMPTDYIFAYYEDADFCMRFLEAGHEISIDRSARWYHMEGVGKSLSPPVRSFMWLNRIIYTQRFADAPNVALRMVDLTVL